LTNCQLLLSIIAVDILLLGTIMILLFMFLILTEFKLMSSTIPLIDCPSSIKSPTLTFSSVIILIPAIKSVKVFCKEKPTINPAIPKLVRIGVIDILRIDRIIINAIKKIITPTILLTY